jgi:hypothetical protein
MNHALLSTELPAPCRQTSRPALRLEPGGLSVLERAKGRRLRVHTGRLWITEPDDPADHFVAAGQTYTVRNKGPVVLECDSTIAATWSAGPEF